MAGERLKEDQLEICRTFPQLKKAQSKSKRFNSEQAQISSNCSTIL